MRTAPPISRSDVLFSAQQPCVGGSERKISAWRIAEGRGRTREPACLTAIHDEPALRRDVPPSSSSQRKISFSTVWRLRQMMLQQRPATIIAVNLYQALLHRLATWMFLRPRTVARSPQSQIREAIGYGAIKMNIDTDLQWAFWEGILANYKQYEGFLQGQLGNPDGADKPNKKHYDPRVWLRKGEESFSKRLEVAFDDLNCINRNA